MLNADYQILGDRVCLVTQIRLIFGRITVKLILNILLFNYLYNIFTIIETFTANVKKRLTNAFLVS